jgi:hypothetical protein
MTLKKRVLSLGLVVAGAAVFATAAFSAVTFDPATYTGFIGRGDVIDALGKDALVDEPAITFEETVTYAQDCSREQQTGKESKTITTTQQSVVAVSGNVNREVRKAKGSGNITGYLLTGGIPVGAAAPTSICGNNWDADGPVYELDSTGGVLYFEGMPIWFSPDSTEGNGEVIEP